MVLIFWNPKWIGPISLIEVLAVCPALNRGLIFLMMLSRTFWQGCVKKKKKNTIASTLRFETDL